VIPSSGKRTRSGFVRRTRRAGIGGVLPCGGAGALSGGDPRTRNLSPPGAFGPRPLFERSGLIVGVLPLGGLVTAALAAWIGPGDAVLVDGLVTLVGGLILVALRPEIRWLGCAALPQACIAATNPVAIAMEADFEAART
jgi:hypothetical protein